MSFTAIRQYPMREVAQRVSRRAVGPLLVRLTRNRHYDMRETLVVSGSPRSGTTWFAEALSALRGSAILFEPEHLLQVPDARRAGLDWHVMKGPGDSWPEGDRYFERVLRGEVITPWTVSHLPLRRAFAPSRWIVKFVDANLMLGWLADRFPVRAPVLVLRHPCAVVASQLRRGWKLDHSPRLPAFFARYPQFSEYVSSLRHPVEWSAAHWCIHTFVPLMSPRPWAFVLTTYEQATCEPESEFGRVFERWQLAMPADLVSRSSRPSGTTDRGSSFSNSKHSVGNWRGALSKLEVNRVVAVVRKFGLDFYTDDPMPDAARLAGPTPVNSTLS